MTKKNFIKEYLHFSRKERIGVMLIVFIMVSVIFLPSFINQNDYEVPIVTDTEWTNLMSSLETKPIADEDGEVNIGSFTYEKSSQTYVPVTGELFYFDPNKINAAGWKKLGLRDKTIKTILNYTSKGGYFRKSSDLQKIYGLHENEFARLEPFIQIENISGSKNTYHKKEFAAPKEFKIKTYEKRTPAYDVVDINEGDLTSFISLPGIGEKLGNRIINFRNKLGGFYSVDQISETYGLPDSTFQKIKSLLVIKESDIKRISINKVNRDELKLHPYIKWNIANAIIEYRNQHGKFTSVEDLKKIILLDDNTYSKIQPYLLID